MKIKKQVSTTSKCHNHRPTHSTGFPQALEIMENLENHPKIPCMEKSWNLKKTWIIMEKSWNFAKKFDETTSSQKTSCQTHKTCVSDS